MERLASRGGPPAVTIPPPHFQWPEISTREIKAIGKYLRYPRVGRFGYPAVVEEFEDNFKRYHGLPYALALNSGTSSLHAAYYALGIGPGDEVIVPTFTFPATATPLFPLGAIPILADCLRDTVTIDPADIERKITRRTRAIAITHLWGHPCEMTAIMKLSRRYRLPVVEDCAHAHGARYRGQLVGTFGAVGCFSLDNQKMMASGEAGILITASRRLFEKALIFSDFGGRVKRQLTLPEFKQYDDTGLGLKYRIHPLAAVIANEKLRLLDRMNRERVGALDYFSARLRETRSITPPVTGAGVERGGYYGYKPVYDRSRLGGLPLPEFIRRLQAEGVDARQTITPPLHRLTLFARSRHYGVAVNRRYRGRPIRYSPRDFPNSEWFQSNHLSFPTFSHRSDRKLIDQYLQAILKVEAWALADLGRGHRRGETAHH